MSEHHFRWIDELGQPGAYAWLSDDSASETAVVFVHGFLGDAEGTWLNFQGMIDTHAAAYYPEWGKADLFFFPYASFLHNISTSADALVKFLNVIYPTPPPSLFQIPKTIPLLPKGLGDLDLAPRSYRRLVLVGHSQGALVIRRALVLIYKEYRDSGIVSPILSSTLALFAPAIFGFKPSGMVGTILKISQVEKLAMLVLSYSPAFGEMDEGTIPGQIQADTKEFLQQAPHFPCFTARVLFGGQEHIVGAMEYTDDYREPDEPDKNHTSICKPRARYPRPFKFVFRKTTRA